jgi:hypothetical protein
VTEAILASVEKPPEQRSRHHVAKKSKARRISIKILKDKYGASKFLPALHRYMTGHYPRAGSPTVHDVFDLYPNLYVERLPNPYIQGDTQPNRIRCVPMEPAKGRQPEVPAQFDVALVASDARSPRSVGLEHLRAARVRVLFDLPSRCGSGTEKFAYVEWYTPFTTIHALSGMFKIKRSTVRGGMPNAEIIPITAIERTAHLLPVTKRFIKQSWTSDTVLDKADEFLFNWYITIDMWAMCVLPRMAIQQAGEEVMDELAKAKELPRGKAKKRKRSVL